MASEIIDEGDDYYTVILNDDDVIDVTFTSCGDEVDYWLAEILRIHRRRLRRLVVGLDLEWRPNRCQGERNPAALLQLCVGRRCLLFHIIFSDYIPLSLSSFLSDRRFTFVGVGILNDAKKLLEDYGLWVSWPTELGSLAAEELERENLRGAGLAALSSVVMGWWPEKKSSVAMSMWDNEFLSLEQVKYAAVDAFVSFEVGRRLLAGEF